MPPLRIAELFAGIGGVTGGLMDAGGFEPVLLIDSDPDAAATFRANFSKYAERYYVRNVGARLTAAALADFAGGGIDGIVGCPPCQGFSQAGLRDPDDERNRLLLEMRRLIRGVRPLFFIMENVPGLLRSPLYTEFTRTLDKDYAICADVLNAAEYGVPQLRRRAVVLGIRRDLELIPSLPVPTHGGSGLVFDYYSGKYVNPADQVARNLLKLRPIKPRSGPRTVLPSLPLVTLCQALGDLPEAAPAFSHSRTTTIAGADAVAYGTDAVTDYQQRMRRAKTAGVLNHRAWRHGIDVVQRLAKLKPGDCPGTAGSRARNTQYFSQAYGRLHPDGLARTVTTNFHNPGGGRFTHYASARTLTLREALRLQGFDDAFRFHGVPATAVERLVGNAFPRLLAEAIGQHVRKLLDPVIGTAVHEVVGAIAGAGAIG